MLISDFQSFQECYYLKNKVGVIDFTNACGVVKGPAAKNDTTENPGYFNEIMSFESRKWSPVATFESWTN